MTTSLALADPTRVLGPKKRKVLLLLLLVLTALTAARAEIYKKNEACDADCTPDTHTCTACHHDVAGACPEGWIADPSAQRQQVDDTSCQYTECTSGGCPADRPHEDKERSKVCVNMDLSKCYTFTCRQEYCCSTLTINKCCRPVNCTLVYEDCLVPEQLSRTNSSVSLLHMTRLPHAANSTFPFFKNLTVPSGQACEKMWGSCSCSDGHLAPGCDAADSSTWTSLDRGPEPLPAGLFLTCSAAMMGCQVPQRYSADAGAPTDSAVRYVALSHGAHATFAFYQASLVAAGEMCVPVFGHCSCDNGRLLPGCSPLNSSTWWALDDDSGSSGLEPGLSLTCTVEEGGSSQDSQRGRHRLVLAGVITSCVLLLLGLLAGITWYCRAHLMFKTWSQLRLGSSYQPVLTGAPERPAAFGGIGEALGTFTSRHMGGFKQQPQVQAAGSSRLRGGRDPSRPLPYPATPEDDVFTLEDLDHDHRDHYPVLPVSRRAEVELNTPSFSHRTQRPASDEVEASDKQPLLAPPASSSSRHPAAAAGHRSSHTHSPEVMISVPEQLEAQEEEDEGEDDERGLMAPQGLGKQHR